MSSVFFPRIRILSKSSSIITKTTNRHYFRQSPVADGNSTLTQIWNKLFGKYLLTTNTLSAGVLLVGGDIIAQEIEYRSGHLAKRYDWMRVGRMFAVGCVQGPLHHFFYRWMDKLWPVVNIKTTSWKIFLDQILMSPLCIILFFYPACFLEKKSLADSNQEFLNKFPLVYSVDWIVWPGAQFLNFQYLHPKYRVIYVNLVTLVYDIFLSYVKHHDVSLSFITK